MNFKPGHLDKNSQSKINNVQVANGTVVYSEKSGLQFIDYADTRHTYGSVLSGIYNPNGFVDFTTSSLNEAVLAIKTNGLVTDGQLIKVGNTIYRYRYINDAHLITTVDKDELDVQAEKIGYIIHLPEYNEGDVIDIDLLVSITSEENGHKMYLIKVIDNVLDLSSCKDLDGILNQDTFDLSIQQNGNIFTITVANASTLKVVSYSLSSSGSSKNEGLYIAAEA